MDNPVVMLLKALSSDEKALATQLYLRGKTVAFGDEDCPVNLGVAFVKSQLDALKEAEATSATSE